MNTKIICFSSGKDNEDILSSEKSIFTLISQLELAPPEISHIAADENELTAELKDAASHCQAIFLCGNTDLSKKVICALYRLTLIQNDYYRAFLEKNILPASQTTTAFPQGSNVTFSRKTGDNAFCVKIPGKIIFALPAIPAAINDVIIDFIIAYFAEEKGRYLSRLNLKLFDVDDSMLSMAIKGIQNTYAVKINKFSRFGSVELEISACSKDANQSDNICYEAINKLKATFGNSIYDLGNRNIAQAAVDMLKRNDITVSTAESCTGGMLSEAITSVSGASDILEIGICAYSNRVKREALGVSQEILSTYGAVSKETAMALAKGIKKLSGSVIGVGITGVAGPDKSEDKDVGTVYIAIFDGKHYWVRLLNGNGFTERNEIREYATATALDLLRRYALFLPDVMPGSSTPDNINLLTAQPDVIAEHTATPTEKEPEAPVTVQEQTKSDVSAEITAIFDSFEESPQQEVADIIAPTDDNSFPLQEAAAPVYSDNNDYFDFIANVPDKQHNTDYPYELAADNYYDESGIIIENDNFDTEEPQAVTENTVKEKSKSSKWIKIAFAVTAVLVLTVAIIFGVYFYKVYRDLSQLDAARETFSSTSKTEAFKVLKKQNKDFTGWINIEDTEINNPLYQSTNNNFYATHNMEKQSSRYGALYFDYRNIVGGENQSENLVIYGQNMDDGTMFGSLSQFRNLSYLSSHSTIVLTTAEKSQTYKIFAVMVTNASKKEDDGNFFDFSRPSFDSEATFNSWLAEVNRKNLYKTDNFDIAYGDTLLTLVTTCSDFTNARLVVVAKRSGSADEAITYSINPTPVFPAAYYKEKGKKVPDFNSIRDNSHTGTSSDTGSGSENTSSDDTSSDDTSSDDTSSDNTSSDSSSSTRPTPSVPTTPSTPSSTESSSSEESSSDDGSSSDVSSSESTSSNDTSSEDTSSTDTSSSSTSGEISSGT